MRFGVASPLFLLFLADFVDLFEFLAESPLLPLAFMCLASFLGTITPLARAVFFRVLGTTTPLS